MGPTINVIQTSYDQVADNYAGQFFHELDHKPLDRELLATFADQVKDLGPVCDLGCGPGHIARFLKALNVDAFGIDLSPGMVRQAQRLNPDIEFRQGDMMSLEADDDDWGGIVCFYTIIHIPRKQVVKALSELRRVLKSGGLLLLSFHLGDETIHVDDWYEKPVSLDFIFFQRPEMERYLESAGFEIVSVTERPPYKDVEYQSRRAYVLARKPGQ
ncbi:MAG: methyltransferase domain-containing protein [Fidelibacterota bacterium]|nr:MAG: methyltransferase domain-containing protein [Candidatus Neomarinimicrobiota bacterium]